MSNIDVMTIHRRVVYIFIDTTSSPAVEFWLLLAKNGSISISKNTQKRREPSLQQTASIQANS